MSNDLEILRHSASHIMASAVVELFKDVKLGIGPAIEDGFYYDFDLPVKLTSDDLPKIEERMRQIINQDYEFIREEIDKKEAINIFKSKNEVYKVELLEEIPDEKVTIYRHNNFVDLCKGPHIKSTKELKYFKLLSTAGAYWRGNEKNPQLQRVYGTAFATKEELDSYLIRVEEAKKRDHRKLGKELELFDIFEEEFGSGLIFWLPKGAIVRKIIEDYLKEFHIKNDYNLITTPHIAKLNLWQTSGHASFYSEYMFSPMDIEGQKYIIKPMNCPGHVLVYKSNIHSYKELPLRYFELGTVYRYERSGVLHGLMRVRGFTQDDAHIFCTLEQIDDELLRLLRLVTDILTKFGFNEYLVTLSTRPEKFIGDIEHWNAAERSLVSAMKKIGLEYVVDEGGGAFYGPKIDLKIKDAIGRFWQCSTIQVDFNLPQRFDVKYRTQEGKDEYAIMIHRALLGSLERFFGVLIEHYAGAFPIWLSPIQAVILPISDKFNEYALKVKDTLLQNGVRVKFDDSSNRLQYKIRNAIAEKIPYLIIIGEKEKNDNTISIRKFNESKTEVVKVDEFVKMISLA